MSEIHQIIDAYELDCAPSTDCITRRCILLGAAVTGVAAVEDELLDSGFFKQHLVNRKLTKALHALADACEQSQVCSQTCELVE